MPLKPPNDLEEGMILASDVCNLDGQILFTKGLELTTRHIDILQMWGIPKVEISGEEEEEEAINLDQFSPAVIEQSEELVNKHFSLVKSSHPAVEIMRKICILKKAKQIARNEKK
ncbi:hypothetical protein MLD52_07650 [Puniceicoccaceae bacterium K14]|nr:hypothetical protein [Puniceicoccaceae bacterium K14]